MRPVYQTRTTGSKCDIEERGDCFQACVAAIQGMEGKRLVYKAGGI